MLSPEVSNVESTIHSLKRADGHLITPGILHVPVKEPVPGSTLIDQPKISASALSLNCGCISLKS